MKAVLITPGNIDMLASRFAVVAEDKPDVLPLGYYLVTDFGNDCTFDTLTPVKLDAYFTKTGVKMQNEFFEVELN